MAATWRERQKVALRARLLDTALKMFRKRGFAQTTVQQIADEAGVGKGTFFNHFPCKVMVLVTWYRDLTLAALAEAEARTHASARGAIQALAAALTSRATADPDLWDMKSQNTFVDTKLLSEEQDLDRLLDEYFMRHLAAGKLRGEVDPDLDERFIAGMFNAILTGTAHSWVVVGHGFDLQETIGARIDLLFQAVAGGGNPRYGKPDGPP